MELGVAHVAEIPEQVGAHAEDDVPERALLAAVPELAELVAHELLVVEVGVGGAARGLAVQHPRGVRPLLVGERGAHHVPPELAPVRGLHRARTPRAAAPPAPAAGAQRRRRRAGSRGVVPRCSQPAATGSAARSAAARRWRSRPGSRRAAPAAPTRGPAPWTGRSRTPPPAPRC